jgi:hypothetical protein
MDKLIKEDTFGASMHWIHKRILLVEDMPKYIAEAYDSGE